MGIVLGSVAVGVLVGYPFGGILYDFVGKSAPFYIISGCFFLNLVFQLIYFDYSLKREVSEDCNDSNSFLKWSLISYSPFSLTSKTQINRIRKIGFS